MYTRFNPENKEVLTFKETLAPAMEITDREDARQYLRDYIAYIQRALDREPREDGMTAEQIARVNLGYYAGYYDREIRARVEELFECEHPHFGKAVSNPISTEDIFVMGLALGKRA